MRRPFVPTRERRRGVTAAPAPDSGARGSTGPGADVGGPVFDEVMEIDDPSRQLWSLPEADQLELTGELDPVTIDMVEGDALLDGLQQAQRDRAQAAAYRFAQVDRFRRHSEASAAARESNQHRSSHGMVSRSMRAELASALRLPERTVETLLARAQMLVEQLPTTLSWLREGRFSERHAVIIADEAVGLSDDERGVFESEVLGYAERLRAGLFERKAQQIRELLNTGDLSARHEDARQRREVNADPGRDGMGWLAGYLPNPELVAIDNRLTSIARSLQVEGEQRTLTQLKADAFVDMLLDEGRLLPPGQSGSELRAPMAHRGFRAEVSVVVPALTVMGLSATPGMLEGGRPVDAETARAIAGTATGFTRILTHPETGVVLSFGKDRYSVPTELKRYLRHRDETCRFVGCARRARFCDIDHTVPWADSGPTAHDNLAHLCRSHHKTKDAGWQVVQARDGSGDLHLRSPLGRDYSTEAAMPLGGTAGAQSGWFHDPPPF